MLSGDAVTEALRIHDDGNLTVAGDLTISGDDLTMGTNTSGYVLVADGTNYNPVAISGDITLDGTGAVAIASGVIVNADVNASADIDMSKTAFIAGTNCTLSTNTLNVDDAFLVNNADDETTGIITINKTSAATNSVTDVLVLKSQSSGTPAAGIGTVI